MTTEIQQNRYDQLLRRVAGIIGPGSKVSEVLSELFPMFDVENVPAELLILAGTRTAQAGFNLAAVAAELGSYQLFNPADSSTIVTITRVQLSSTGSGFHQWGMSSAVFGTTTAATEEFTDSRNLATTLPVAVLRGRSSGAAAASASVVRMLANTPSNLHNENAIAVLSPGFGFEIGFGTVNFATTCYFNWRERVAEQSELSL